MNGLTPMEYLEGKNIDLRTTSFITLIDGCFRQPDLCILLQEFANIKMKELDLRVTEESKLESQIDA